MNAKFRDAQLQKIPYMLVVGDKEATADAVSVRLHTNVDIDLDLLALSLNHLCFLIAHSF